MFFNSLKPETISTTMVKWDGERNVGVCRTRSEQSNIYLLAKSQNLFQLIYSLDLLVLLLNLLLGYCEPNCCDCHYKSVIESLSMVGNRIWIFRTNKLLDLEQLRFVTTRIDCATFVSLRVHFPVLQQQFI